MIRWCERVGRRRIGMGMTTQNQCGQRQERKQSRRSTRIGSKESHVRQRRASKVGASDVSGGVNTSYGMNVQCILLGQRHFVRERCRNACHCLELE